MIKGIGVDIASLASVSPLVSAADERGLRRVFTSAEIDLCRQSPHALARFAARFAAKEAVLKAFGTGWGRHGPDWTDIEVSVTDQGRPLVAMHGKARQQATDMGVERTWISLSHEGDYAVALVVFEGP